MFHRLCLMPAALNKGVEDLQVGVSPRSLTARTWGIAGTNTLSHVEETSIADWRQATAVTSEFY